MKEESKQKQHALAAMAEFAAAYQVGKREKMAAFMSPGANLVIHDASGVHEMRGAKAACAGLESFKGAANVQFSAAKVEIREAGAAWVEAKLERYGAAGDARQATHAAGAQASAAEMHGAKARIEEAHSAGLLRAELEMKGDQWRLKHLDYRPE
jgi:hypothetical protein